MLTESTSSVMEAPLSLVIGTARGLFAMVIVHPATF